MKKIWPILLVAIIVLLVGVAAYLYGQSSGLSQKEAEKTTTVNTKISAAPTQAAIEQGLTPAVSATGSAGKVTTIIEAEGSLPAQDVSELKARVINPYVDYHEEVGSQPLATLKVSQNPNQSKNVYQYMADAIFVGGANEGFLIQKTNGHIDWWLPECLNGCNLSAGFKIKYPEIAAKVN